MRVLLVEDHDGLREMMAAHLLQSGFVTDAVGRGDAAITAAGQHPYDAVILDLGLPDCDGLEVLRALRADPVGGVPVLVLTARDAIDDRVRGLDAGADDYLLKPFDLGEFDARLRSLLRRPKLRATEARDSVLRFGRLALDGAAHEARIGARALDLTRREVSLLEELVRAEGRTVVRDALEDRLWGSGAAVSGNALEAVVSRLRRKLALSGSGLTVETLRGIGYRLAGGA